MLLPEGSGVNSKRLDAECSNSPDPSAGALSRTTSLSDGVPMLCRGTLKINNTVEKRILIKRPYWATTVFLSDDFIIYCVRVSSCRFYLRSDELNRQSRTCITCKDLYGFTLFFILFCIGCKRSKLQADKFKFACFRASMCTLFFLYSVYD